MRTPSDRLTEINGRINNARVRILAIEARLQKGEWKEEDHPRADDGRFGDKAGEHEGEKKEDSDNKQNFQPSNKKPGPLSPDDDLLTNKEKWKGQEVPNIVDNLIDVPKGQKIIVWEMENGHLHGFGTEKMDWRDDDSTPPTWREYELADQGDYAAAVQDFERTKLSDVRCYSLEGSDEQVGAEYRRMIEIGDAKYRHDDLDDLSNEELAQKIGDEGIELP